MIALLNGVVHLRLFRSADRFKFRRSGAGRFGYIPMQTTLQDALKMNSRILYMDGLRGLAILLVVGYHAFARWPELVPYGATHAQVPLFRFGFLGVQMFFLISGFVILMTLEKCSGPKDFLRRRWLRLFPAMLVCSLVIFATAGYFHERPAGQPSIASMLPGLLFIEPKWLKDVVGLEARPLEGAFWSLYVEFKFYVIAALLYFLAKKERFTTYVFGLFALAILAKELNETLPTPFFEMLNSWTLELSLRHFGYFAAGAEFYKFAKSGDVKHFFVGVGMALVSAHGSRYDSFDLYRIGAAAVMSLFFAAVVFSAKLQEALGTRLFVLMGFVSYPLYLLHENMMISMIRKMGDIGVPMPSFLYPIMAMVLIGAVAYLVAAHLEPLLKRALQGAFRRAGGTASA